MNQTQQLEKEKRSRNIFNYTVYADKQKLPVQFYGRPHLGFQLQEEFFPVHLLGFIFQQHCFIYNKIVKA